MTKDKRATSRWVGESETCCCPKKPQQCGVSTLLEEQWLCAPPWGSAMKAPTLGICNEEMSSQISGLENQWGWCPRGPKNYRELRFSFQGTYLWSYSPQDPVQKQKFEKHLGIMQRRLIC